MRDDVLFVGRAVLRNDLVGGPLRQGYFRPLCVHYRSGGTCICGSRRFSYWRIVRVTVCLPEEINRSHQHKHASDQELLVTTHALIILPFAAGWKLLM